MSISLGSKIRTLRKELKFNTATFAEKVGLSQGYISHIETDKKVPTPETLKQIATLLNGDYAELLELAGYRDLAKFEKMKNEDTSYFEDIKSVEDAVEALNLLWSDGDGEYKLVLERNNEPNTIHLDELLNTSSTIKYNGTALDEEVKNKLIAVLDIIFK